MLWFNTSVKYLLNDCLPFLSSPGVIGTFGFASETSESFRFNMPSERSVRHSCQDRFIDVLSEELYGKCKNVPLSANGHSKASI